MELYPHQQTALISIHALREEGDNTCRSCRYLNSGFLSTPSARRATSAVQEFVIGSENFYPRPPRGGRPGHINQPGEITNFYPRPPRGGRRGTHDSFSRYGIFLSTPSARRATGVVAVDGLVRVISIHALREEGDSRRRAKMPLKSYFYPRPPRGGRQYRNAQRAILHNNFYPRPPRGGRREWPRAFVGR